MGYDICTTPGARWFAVHSCISNSLKSFPRLPHVGEAKGMRDLCALYKIRLDFARGILLMAGHRSETGNIYKNLQKAAEVMSSMDAAVAGKVLELSAPKFSVSYGGSGQYGVPNYELIRGTESESATQTLGPLLQAAYAERHAHA